MLHHKFIAAPFHGKWSDEYCLLPPIQTFIVMKCHSTTRVGSPMFPLYSKCKFYSYSFSPKELLRLNSRFHYVCPTNIKNISEYIWFHAANQISIWNEFGKNISVDNELNFFLINLCCFLFRIWYFDGFEHMEIVPFFFFKCSKPY